MVTSIPKLYKLAIHNKIKLILEISCKISEVITKAEVITRAEASRERSRLLSPRPFVPRICLHDP